MRRTFITGLGVVLAVPLDTVAQQPGKTYRAGFLGTITESAIRHLLEAFRRGMHDLGWTDRNFVLESRFAEGRAERLPGLAAELVALNVDVIIAGNNASVAAAKQATTTIPIVMMANDPVGSGFVETLARPGRNITGLSYDVTPDTFGKHIEFLKDVVPGISRVAVLPLGNGLELWSCYQIR